MHEELASVFGVKTMTYMLKLLEPLGAGKYKKLVCVRPFSITKMKSNVYDVCKHMELHDDFLMVQDKTGFQIAGLGHKRFFIALNVIVFHHR